ncbi:MAG: hypothetical protein ACK57X_13495, partial [Bacteroidota bacterium]
MLIRLHDKIGGTKVKSNLLIGDKMIARNYFGLNEDQKVLLFFGFIRPYKGLDLLIEGLAKTKSENIKLIIDGEFYTDEKPYFVVAKLWGIVEI